MLVQVTANVKEPSALVSVLHRMPFPYLCASSVCMAGRILCTCITSTLCTDDDIQEYCSLVVIVSAAMSSYGFVVNVLACNLKVPGSNQARVCVLYLPFAVQYAVVTKLLYSLIALGLFVFLSDAVSTEDCWGKYLLACLLVICLCWQ